MHPKPRAEGAHKIEPAKQVQKNREHVSRFFYFEREKSFPGTFFRPCSAKSAIGLTYGKTMREAVEIGTRLASSVITVSENVCPRFLPQELGLDVKIEE